MVISAEEASIDEIGKSRGIDERKSGILCSNTDRRIGNLEAVLLLGLHVFKSLGGLVLEMSEDHALEGDEKRTVL